MHKVCGVTSIELSHQIFPVSFHCMDTDVQFGRDLLTIHPLSNRKDDFMLPFTDIGKFSHMTSYNVVHPQK